MAGELEIKKMEASGMHEKVENNTTLLVSNKQSMILCIPRLNELVHPSHPQQLLIRQCTICGCPWYRSKKRTKGLGKWEFASHKLKHK